MVNEATIHAAFKDAAAAAVAQATLAEHMGQPWRVVVTVTGMPGGPVKCRLGAAIGSEIAHKT